MTTVHQQRQRRLFHMKQLDVYQTTINPTLVMNARDLDGMTTIRASFDALKDTPRKRAMRERVLQYVKENIFFHTELEKIDEQSTCHLVISKPKVRVSVVCDVGISVYNGTPNVLVIRADVVALFKSKVSFPIVASTDFFSYEMFPNNLYTDFYKMLTPISDQINEYADYWQ